MTSSVPDCSGAMAPSICNIVEPLLTGNPESGHLHYNGHLPKSGL